MLVAVEERAAALYDLALAHYGAGRCRSALGCTAEAARLTARDETLELLACAALRAGEFATALKAAQRRKCSSDWGV